MRSKQMCSHANRSSVDPQDFAAHFASLGPLPYVDLRMNLSFPCAVEVWIDTFDGLEASATPVSCRFLFLMEPDQVTRLG